MKIKSIKVIEGKNKWSESKDKLIHMVLDLGGYEQKPSNKIEGFYERIKEHLPSLKSHRCSEGKVGGFLKRIKEGTWMGHIIEHVALELQTLAGYDTGWGRTRGVKGQKGVYNVVFNYENEECGKLAAKEAYNVVNDIINDRDPQIDKIVEKLKPKKQIRESIRRILKEETNSKREGMLNILKDVGLYDFTRMTGLKYMDIVFDVGELPRDIKIQYLKDVISDLEQIPGELDLTFITGSIPLYENDDWQMVYVGYISNENNELKVHTYIVSEEGYEDDYDVIFENDLDNETLDILVTELSEKLQHERNTRI